jgi:mycothiol synthase
LLQIRDFVAGKDEKTWLDIINESFKNNPEYIPLTADEFMKIESSPGFKADGMYLAELEGTAAGCVRVMIEKEWTERKGIIGRLAVLPRFRNRGIGRTLLEKAVDKCRSAGMDVVITGTGEGDTIACHLLESMDFKLTRSSSQMVIALSPLPERADEKEGFSLKKMGTSNDDIRLITDTLNETFRNHYNFIPRKEDSVRFALVENPMNDRIENFIAYLGERVAGILTIAVIRKQNEPGKTRTGWIATVGVVKQYRRMGIGTALILHGLRAIESMGMEEALLGVDDFNEYQAKALYEKLGFRIKLKQLTYEKTLSK